MYADAVTNQNLAKPMQVCRLFNIGCIIETSSEVHNLCLKCHRYCGKVTILSSITLRKTAFEDGERKLAERKYFSTLAYTLTHTLNKTYRGCGAGRRIFIVLYFTFNNIAEYPKNRAKKVL